MSKYILEVNNVTKFYGRRAAVDNVSLRIQPGEIFGLIGGNGAGKTTLIKIIAGLASPSEGTVKIDGEVLNSNIEKSLAKIGGIIETPSMHSHLSGYDNLKYYASLHPNVPNKRIWEVINLVGMQNRVKDKVRTYSLGMKQRVGIAQALIHSPKLLILDEPTNGLDPSGIKEMRTFLSKLAKEEKIGILICSHILSELEQLCTTVGIIDNGKLIETKSIEEINKDIENKQKVLIKTDYPNYAGKLIIQKYLIKDVEVAGNNVIFPATEDMVPKITQTLVTKGLSIYLVDTIRKSLEELFLEILEKRKSKSASVAII